MTQLARSLAAAAFGLVSSASHAFTASPPQFTVTASIASHCMVATAAAGAAASGADPRAPTRGVVVICSRDASVGSVRLEPAPGVRRRQGTEQVDPELRWVRVGAPGTRDALACAAAAGMPAGAVLAPLVVCAVVRDSGGAVADRGRTVTVIVTYE